jgi:hypothetical protein
MASPTRHFSVDTNLEILWSQSGHMGLPIASSYGGQRERLERMAGRHSKPKPQNNVFLLEPTKADQKSVCHSQPQDYQGS